MAQKPKESDPTQAKYQLIDGLNRVITITENTRKQVEKLDPKNSKFTIKLTNLMLGYSEACKKAFG